MLTDWFSALCYIFLLHFAARYLDIARSCTTTDEYSLDNNTWDRGYQINERALIVFVLNKIDPTLKIPPPRWDSNLCIDATHAFVPHVLYETATNEVRTLLLKISGFGPFLLTDNQNDASILVRLFLVGD